MKFILNDEIPLICPDFMARNTGCYVDPRSYLITFDAIQSRRISMCSLLMPTEDTESLR